MLNTEPVIRASLIMHTPDAISLSMLITQKEND